MFLQKKCLLRCRAFHSPKIFRRGNCFLEADFREAFFPVKRSLAIHRKGSKTAPNSNNLSHGFHRNFLWNPFRTKNIQEILKISCRDKTQKRHSSTQSSPNKYTRAQAKHPTRTRRKTSKLEQSQREGIFIVPRKITRPPKSTYTTCYIHDLFIRR